MRAVKLLHKMLDTTMHKSRLASLLEITSTALAAKSLSVTTLGRHIENRCYTRSNIRKVDRLFSNGHLVSARASIYQALTHFLVQNKQPTILIDGSKILNTQFYTLRATLAAPGRSLTLYEEVFEQKEYGSSKLYARFLDNLSLVLPQWCRPTLVTDAEFRGPWFLLVYEKNWNFVGRLRASRNCSLGGDGDFHIVESRKVIASHKPKYLGAGYINKDNPVAGNFYTYKKPPKGRHAYTRSGRHSETRKSLNNARSATESWFLFSSLKRIPTKIVSIYTARMECEENFRDTKSVRFGLSLNLTRTKDINRCRVMLIVAALASAVAYLVGCVMERQGLQKRFQANSISSRRVLSRFFLGCEALRRNMPLLFGDISTAIKRLNFTENVCA